MKIIGVDRAILGVDDMNASQRFLTEFGLKPAEQGASGATFMTRVAWLSGWASRITFSITKMSFANP